MADIHSELMGLLARVPYVRCEDVHRQYAVNWLMNNGVTVPVRCKDCKWYNRNEDIMPQSGSCEFHEMVKMDWDFCSRAKMDGDGNVANE